MGDVDELGLVLILGGIVAIVYYLNKNGLFPWTKNTGTSGLGWPSPGQTGTNLGGQTVGTSNIGTQFNIHGGLFGGGNLWTIFPPDGSAPIVDINADTTPVGPAGQSISQLQASGLSNQDIADMIGMGGIGAPGGGTSTPVGGAGGCF